MDYDRELIDKFFNRDLSKLVFEDSFGQSWSLGQIIVYLNQLQFNKNKLNYKKWYRISGKPNKINLFILLFGLLNGLKLEICDNEDDFDDTDYQFQKNFNNVNTKLNLSPKDLNDLKQSTIKRFLHNSDNFILKITTSGSTGVPKAVFLTFDAISFQGLSISNDLKLEKIDRQLFYMPINYVYGLSIISTWMASQSVLVEAEYDLNQPGKFLNSIINRSISVFSGVPYIYSLMVDRWGVEKLISSNVRILTQAGGRLPYQTKESLISTIGRIEFWVMYGQTEFGARISQYKCSLDSLNDKCVGRPLNGVKIHIKDSKDSNGTTQVGEIYVSSPSNCLNINEITQSRLINGDIYYSTGDYGWQEEEMLYVSGRNKNFIKVSGKRISKEPIFNTMLEFESVYDCVIESNSKKFPQIIVGLIGDAFPECESQSSLMKKINKETNNEDWVKLFKKIPFFIYVLHGEIPRLKNGKLAISKLGKMLKEVSEDQKNSVHIWL